MRFSIIIRLIFVVLFFVIVVKLLRKPVIKPTFNDNKPQIKILDLELGLGVKDIDSYRELYTLKEKEDKIFLKIKWINVKNTSTCKQIIIKRYIKPMGSSDSPKFIGESIINNTTENFEKYFTETSTHKTYTIGYDDLTSEVSVMGENYINFEVVLEDGTKHTVLSYDSNTNPPVIDQNDIDISMNELGNGITKSFVPIIPSVDIQPEIKRTPYNIQCLRFRTKSITYNLSDLENNTDRLFFIPHPSGTSFTLQFEQSDGFRYIQSTGGITKDVNKSARFVLVNAEKFKDGFLSRLGVINTDSSFAGHLIISEGTSISNSTIEVTNQIDTRNKVQSSYFIISGKGYFPWCGKIKNYDKYLNYTRNDVMSTELTDNKDKLYTKSVPNNIGMARIVYNNNISNIRVDNKSFFIIGKGHTDFKWNIYVDFKDLIKAFFDNVYIPFEDGKCESSLAPFSRIHKGVTDGTNAATGGVTDMNINVFNMDLDFVVNVDWTETDKSEYEKIINGIDNPAKSVEFVNHPTHYYRCKGYEYAFPNGSCINKEGTTATKDSYITDTADLCEADCKKNEKCVGYSWKDNNCFQAALTSTKYPWAVYSLIRSSSAFDQSYTTKVKQVAGAFMYNVPGLE